MLKGAAVTTDAMGCQRKIARVLIEGGANYVLAVKDNQRPLAKGLRDVFKIFDQYPEIYQQAREHVTAEKGHGRAETRRVVAYDVTGIASIVGQDYAPSPKWRLRAR